MQINKCVCAGVYKKSDAKITLEESDILQIDIESSVGELFGDDIENSIRQFLLGKHIDKGHIKVEDKGALSWVILSRLQAALARLED